jgi:hypothetical protein
MRASIAKHRWARRLRWSWIALLAFACEGDDGTIDGRIFLAPIASETGTNVGLAVDFRRTRGPREDVERLGLRVLSTVGLFLSGNAVDPSKDLCLQFPSSGRLSLMAEGDLQPSARVRVSVHRPVDVARGTSSAGSRSDGGAPSTESDACSGAMIDDAAWPTRGAQVIVLDDPDEGAGGTRGVSGAGGAGGESGGEAGSGGSAGDGGGPEGDGATAATGGTATAEAGGSGTAGTATGGTGGSGVTDIGGAAGSSGTDSGGAGAGGG